jgi:hypothetical protein
MLEAAFIEARPARPVKAVGPAGQGDGARPPETVVQERRFVTGEPGKHYCPIITEVAATSLTIADCLFSSCPLAPPGWISWRGVARSLLAIIAMPGGTMPSSRIYRVPLAQHFCAFRVLRWCPRPGNENMPCDGTPPRARQTYRRGGGSVAISDGNGPGSIAGRRVFPHVNRRKGSVSYGLPGHPPGICCDLRSCPCAPAGLPIRHLLPGCAPVPGITGNTNRHLAC